MNDHINDKDIMEMLYEHFGIDFPEKNLYDGNYETVNFLGDEMKEMNIFKDNEVDDDDEFCTHQYVVDDEVFTIVTNENNTEVIMVIQTSITTGKIKKKIII